MYLFIFYSSEYKLNHLIESYNRFVFIWHLRKATSAKGDLCERRPLRKATSAKGDLCERRPLRKATSAKGDLCERRPLRKATSAKGNLYEMPPLRKMTSAKGYLCSRWPLRKATSTKGDLCERRPLFKVTCAQGDRWSRWTARWTNIILSREIIKRYIIIIIYLICWVCRLWLTYSWVYSLKHISKIL